VNVGALLDRLDRVCRNGSNWKARCPAHGDREPSLFVCVGDDGRILIRCFARLLDRAGSRRPREAARQGRLPCVMIGRYRRFVREDVLEWVERQKGRRR
jgi:excisionase family DNA binding protein